MLQEKKKKKTNSQHSKEGILFSMNLTNQITFHKVGWQFGLSTPSGPYWLDGTIFLHFFIYHWTLEIMSHVPALPWKSLCRGKRETESNMTTQTPGLSRKKVAGRWYLEQTSMLFQLMPNLAVRGTPQAQQNQRDKRGLCLRPGNRKKEKICCSILDIATHSPHEEWVWWPGVNSGVFQLLIPTFFSHKCRFECLIWIAETWTASNSLFSVFLHSGEHFSKHQWVFIKINFKVNDLQIISIESWVDQLHFSLRFRRFLTKICEKCLLSADFPELDCILLPKLILILLPCTFSLMTSTAHISRPWNIDESFPVALLMQQLLWAVINRLIPFWLKCLSVSTWTPAHEKGSAWHRCCTLRAEDW